MSGAAPAVPEVGVVAHVLDDWDGVRQPRHYLLERLARYFRVAWVAPASTWRGRWRNGRLRPAAPRRIAAGLTILDADAGWPSARRPRGLARRLLLARAAGGRRQLAGQGCRRFVSYLWYPTFAPLLDAPGFSATCYHIDDEYSWSDDPGPPGPEERALITRADRVFIHSPGLMDSKGAINPHTVVIPNGADTRAFATPLPEPADLVSIPHPRVGYVGVLKRQLDWDLLAGLAAARPDWSLVLVGPLKAEHPELASRLAALRQRGNVHWLGARPADALPGYVQHLEVALLPYRRTGYTDCIYPMKLHESLAAGVPVVATSIRTLREHGDLVGLADTVEDTAAAVGAALASAADVAARERRREVARRHDWELLAARVAMEMAAVLGADESRRVAAAVPPEWAGALRA